MKFELQLDVSSWQSLSFNFEFNLCMSFTSHCLIRYLCIIVNCTPFYMELQVVIIRRS